METSGVEGVESIIDTGVFCACGKKQPIPSQSALGQL